MLAQNIKRLRIKKGLSQERLARLADISYNTIVKIENDASKNPTVKTIIKIAKALNVSVDELIKNSYL
jgi:transcriptional regulator with XRE-family HTH domain